MEFNFSDWEIVERKRLGRYAINNKNIVKITQQKDSTTTFYFYEPAQKEFSLQKGDRYRLAFKPKENMVALLKSDLGNLITKNSKTLSVSFKHRCFFGDCIEVPLEDIETDECGNIVFYLSGKPKKEQTATDQKLAKIKAIASVTLETIINVLKDKKGGAPETFIKTETIRRLKNNGDEVVGSLYIQELLESNTSSLFNMVEFGKNNRYFSLKG